MAPLPRITFGLIVLNGEPFLRYNLRALYPFAHQIIVVEGAAPDAAGIATPEGHSTDETLETLKQFKQHEDPEQKLIVVTAETEGHSNGFWPGEKHEQSQAYARRATGEYLWQVDVDEFYQPDDMRAVMEMLRSDPAIAGMSFKMITFWGGFDYLTDGWYLRRGADTYHRLFRWGPGHLYATHRPPTVLDAAGRNLRDLHWISGPSLARRGIRMCHYSLLFPKQVTEKCEYYRQAGWNRQAEAQRWAQECYLRLGNPYRVHNVYEHPSWLERFAGTHPPQVEALRRDLAAGQLTVATRPVADIQQLLGSWKYRAGCAGLKFLDYWDRSWKPGQRLPQHPLVWLLALGPRACRKAWQAACRRTQPADRLHRT